jgi:hypothetical protein
MLDMVCIYAQLGTPVQYNSRQSDGFRQRTQFFCTASPRTAGDVTSAKTQSATLTSLLGEREWRSAL